MQVGSRQREERRGEEREGEGRHKGDQANMTKGM